MLLSLLRKTQGFQSSTKRLYHTRRTLLRAFNVDEHGRRVRTTNKNNAWDDFEPDTDWLKEKKSPSKVTKHFEQRRNDRNGRRDDRRNDRGPPRQKQHKKEDNDRKINMRALEGAGFVHLYGLAPVLNALKADRRDFTRPEDWIDIDELEGADLVQEQQQRDRKPEAQFSPWLFVQETRGTSRARDKAARAAQVLELAEQVGVPVAYVDKGVLNTLSGNRPHQGFVLRCGSLSFESLSRLPAQGLWLALDEVMDPQNLGALIRSASYLGKINLLVCAKNSAPPSPAVSAASAGALEVADIYSTSNLPRTLTQAVEDGFRVIGASSSLPEGDDEMKLYDLNDLPCTDGPTILVLGSEGHGLRNLVEKSCTELVRIPGSDDDDCGVDSLNVSVSGGILMWHLVQKS